MCDKEKTNKKTDDSSSSIHEVITRLQEENGKLHKLCKENFINVMIQEYAGANPECLYCGGKYPRRSPEKPVEHKKDCPVTIYKEILKTHDVV
jgi:hypothetical protein